MQAKYIAWAIIATTLSSCTADESDGQEPTAQSSKRGPRLTGLLVDAPADVTREDANTHICVGGVWADDCDHVVSAPAETGLSIPFSGRISLDAPSFYEFNLEEIKRMASADTMQGGYIKLEWTAPTGECSNVTYADMRLFWQSVALTDTNRTLVWNGDLRFDHECPLTRSPAHLSMQIRLPWIYKGTFTGNSFMTMSSDPEFGKVDRRLVPLQVSTEMPGGPPSALDFVFVIDTTGSMWDDIAAVKSSSIEIVDAIFTEVADPRVGIIDFRDFPTLPYGGATDYPFRLVLDFSSDRNQIIAGIQSLALGYGGNTPESVFSGVLAAIRGNTDHTGKALGPWRADARKNILVIGDAPGHDPEPFTGYTLQQVIDAANAGGISTGARSTDVEVAADDSGIAIHTLQIGFSSAARVIFEALASGTEGRAVVAMGASNVVAVILDLIDEIGGDNLPPDTTWSRASIDRLWPPNHEMVAISIENVVDPEGDTVSITITNITQDEPVVQNDEDLGPDATGLNTDRAYLRAERGGSSGGRVYRVTFTARDSQGAEAEGSVLVCVPHDRGTNASCEDDGQLYDSTVP